MASKAFNIKWKKHGDHYNDALSNYLNKQILCDVTLTSEGKFFKAHQIVLASCSKYFENIFLEIPTNSYPVVILKDVTALEIELLLSCIYKGDVNVPKDLMTKFLQTCEALRIEGFYTHVDENAGSNDDVFHSLQNPQNSAEVGNRNKDIVDLLKSVDEIIAECRIESQKNKQTSVLNSPPVDSQKSFVFTLNESANVPKTTADLSSESIIIEESQAEVMEISDDEDANENEDLPPPLEKVKMAENTNENIQQVSKLNTEENRSESEELSYNSLNDDLSLRLSPSSLDLNYQSDDSEIIVAKRKPGPSQLSKMKKDAIHQAKRMKVIINKPLGCDLLNKWRAPPETHSKYEVLNKDSLEIITDNP